MKIKTLLLSADKQYSERFINYVSEHFSDKLEVNLFSNIENAKKFLSSHPIDILLMDVNIAIPAESVPQNCQVVFFVEEKGICVINSCHAICKYQSMNNIYKEILELFAEKIGRSSIKVGTNGNSEIRLLTFYSASGGVGGSTAAAACARYLSEYRHECVLYINLEHVGSANLYFYGEGEQNFSHVLYALATNNSGTAIKMEGALKHDACGVYFYSSPDSSLDMLELDVEMMDLLFEKLREMNLFDWLVVDMDFMFNELNYQQIERSSATVFTSDGSINANYKLNRILEALKVVASQRESLNLENVSILYNRFSSKFGKIENHYNFPVIGGISQIKNATQSELIQIIANQKGELFESIIK